MTVDLLIKDGNVYTPIGAIKCNLAIDDGRIVSLASEGNSPKADKIIDCNGKLVLPGIIDPHVHFRDPGYTHKEDYVTGSRAAAAGGITMAMDQPNTNPVPNTIERFEAHKANASKKSLIDFNHFASPLRIEEVPKIAAAGAIGFKIFQKAAAYPYDTEASKDDYYHILKAFKAVAKTNRPCSIHPHATDIYEGSMKELDEKGEMNWESFVATSWRGINYAATVPTLIYLAEKAGVRFYPLHCGFKDYVEIIRDAKAAGKNVFTDCEFSQAIPAPRGKNPGILKGQYVATEEDVKATWEGLLDGTIDFVDSDHAPHTREEIEIGLEDPRKMALGYGSIEHYFPLLLNEASKGRISIEHLIKICSSNIAKLLNIYPRKGALQIGSDGDVTIVDPKKIITITEENLYTKIGWTPYEGCEVKGVPIYTIVRGEIVMEHGDVIGKPGYGQFIRPEI
jgi:dihydroorotase